MMGIEWLKPGVFFGSLLYALVGVGVFWLCFVIIDKLTPYDLWAEIIEKKNVALEAQHAPQPSRAEPGQLPGMLELRRTQASAQPLLGLRPL